MNDYTLAISSWFGVRDVEAFTRDLDHHANPGLPETRIDTRIDTTVRVAFSSQWQTYDAPEDWDYDQVEEIARQHIIPGHAAIFMYVDASSPESLAYYTRWSIVTSRERLVRDLPWLLSEVAARMHPGATNLGF